MTASTHGPNKKKDGFYAFFPTHKPRPRKTLHNPLSLPSFVLTWHVAGKGNDRFYAWPVALALQKKGFLCQVF
ncbi:hypothetical protein ACEOWG_003330 [Bacillus cereus]